MEINSYREFLINVSWFNFDLNIVKNKAWNDRKINGIYR